MTSFVSVQPRRGITSWLSKLVELVLWMSAAICFGIVARGKVAAIRANEAAEELVSRSAQARLVRQGVRQQNGVARAFKLKQLCFHPNR